MSVVKKASQRAYFDTSIVAPLYRNEAMSAVAESLQQRWAPVISLLTEVELHSTVARWVRAGELNDQQANEIEQAFAEDLRLNVFERANLENRHYWQARSWLQQRNSSLRTLDSLHLACAAENSLPMITADQKLYNAARTFKVKTHLAQPNPTTLEP
jgi:uncharacterized protein